MPDDFLSRITRGPMLCDGAMGTLLYAKGIFINRCYDELNLSQPDLIRKCTTSTCRPAPRSSKPTPSAPTHSAWPATASPTACATSTATAPKLAREAAKAFDVYVAGSVGPLGVRIEPLGKTSLDEARDAFRQQIAALAEGGVDLIILETFGYLEELHQAMLAARDVAPKLPVVAQVTIDDEGNCLDGSTPETFGKKLTAWGADVIGCNCSVGPVTMLERAGAPGHGHRQAALRAAQRRHAAQRRRPQHLPLLAGVHGELRAQIPGGGRQAGRRMLRHHAGTHPRHEGGAARGQRAQRFVPGSRPGQQRPA